MTPRIFTKARSQRGSALVECCFAVVVMAAFLLMTKQYTALGLQAARRIIAADAQTKDLWRTH